MMARLDIFQTAMKHYAEALDEDTSHPHRLYITRRQLRILQSLMRRLGDDREATQPQDTTRHMRQPSVMREVLVNRRHHHQFPTPERPGRRNQNYRRSQQSNGSGERSRGTRRSEEKRRNDDHRGTHHDTSGQNRSMGAPHIPHDEQTSSHRGNKQKSMRTDIPGPFQGPLQHEMPGPSQGPAQREKPSTDKKRDRSSEPGKPEQRTDRKRKVKGAEKRAEKKTEELRNISRTARGKEQENEGEASEDSAKCWSRTKKAKKRARTVPPPDTSDSSDSSTSSAASTASSAASTASSSRGHKQVAYELIMSASSSSDEEGPSGGSHSRVSTPELRF